MVSFSGSVGLYLLPPLSSASERPTQPHTEQAGMAASNKTFFTKTGCTQGLVPRPGATRRHGSRLHLLSGQLPLLPLPPAFLQPLPTSHLSPTPNCPQSGPPLDFLGVGSPRPQESGDHVHSN